MNFKFVKRGIVASALACTILLQAQGVFAAEEPKLLVLVEQDSVNEFNKDRLISAIPEIKNTEKTIKIENIREISLNIMVSGKVFVGGAEKYTLVASAPEENSSPVGKVYEDSVVRITERGNVWSKISSGNVIGYVKTEALITGEGAVVKAKELLKMKYPESDILALSKDEVEHSFSVGETLEEEATRLAAEEAARVAAKKATSRKKGLEVVTYAKKFLGNPYVYGGTSLTRGADCSGFIRGVYRHFGVELPHSSYGMRRVGYAVSYSEIQPGDIICYSGHVGIYAGNGKIVNAIDENKGIGMSNARYKSIVTIRRIF